MIKENGTLILGIEHEGETYKEFSLHPAKIRYTIEAMESDPRATKNEQYLGVCILAKQISVPGISEVSTDMLMELTQEDMQEITEANERLRKQIARFRKGDQTPENADSCRSEVRI